MPKQPKLEKGATQRLSLHLFKEGKSIADIATERNLSPGTIEGHLASFIASGDVDVLDLVSQERLDMILKVIDELDSTLHSSVSKSNDSTEKQTSPKVDTKATTASNISSTLIKEKLPADFTYAEVKAAYSYAIGNRQR